MGDDPFASLNPCTLLDQALKDEGYPAAVPSSADPSKARTGDVNGRQAVQVKGRLGSKGACEIFMDVKSSSRAIVVVTLVSRNTDEACTYAGQEATKIEPLLPK